MIEVLKHWADILLHADNSLRTLVADYKGWTYLILILIIFCETGLVVTPFLPGDSLLFAAGTVASGLHVLNIYTLVITLFLAAFAGDNSNYFFGRYIGPKVFSMNFRFIKRDYLVKTHMFYEKHGGQTIIIARFIPIIRTFAPFVAGISIMDYKKFLIYSIAGNILWINLFLWVGYLLGTNKYIEQHFSAVTLIIIAVSLLPGIYGIIKNRFATK